MNMLEQPTKTTLRRSISRNIRVMLWPDQPDWAFDNISKNIIKNKQPGFDVVKEYAAGLHDNPARFFEAIIGQRIDVCHFFWRDDLFWLLSGSTMEKAADMMGLEANQLAASLRSTAFTTSVYDHLHLEQSALAQRRRGFATVDGYTVSSRKLMQLYCQQEIIPQPDRVITDGVDTTLFSPAVWSSGKNERKEHLIGWVGNSQWGKSSFEDHKGYGRLFVPMMAALERQNAKFKAKVADPKKAPVPFGDMPDFYRSLSVFVCTSAAEGTPNPVMEAMACGIPIVSTDVGIVRDVVGPLQNRFCLTQPSVDNLVAGVAEICANTELYHALSKENRQQAERWDWSGTTEQWWPFWAQTFDVMSGTRNVLRREMSFGFA